MVRTAVQFISRRFQGKQTVHAGLTVEHLQQVRSRRGTSPHWKGQRELEPA